MVYIKEKEKNLIWLYIEKVSKRKMANLTKRKLYSAIYYVEKETELETLRHLMIIMAKIEGETLEEIGNNSVLCCATNYYKLAKFLKQKTEEIIEELKEYEEK